MYSSTHSFMPMRDFVKKTLRKTDGVQSPNLQSNCRSTPYWFTFITVALLNSLKTTIIGCIAIDIQDNASTCVRYLIPLALTSVSCIEGSIRHRIIRPTTMRCLFLLPIIRKIFLFYSAQTSTNLS
jgi:hypothetical protein